MGDTEDRVARLEADMRLLAWLHAEIMHALRLAAAAKIAERVSPKIKAQIMKRISGL